MLRCAWLYVKHNVQEEEEEVGAVCVKTHNAVCCAHVLALFTSLFNNQSRSDTDLIWP